MIDLINLVYQQPQPKPIKAQELYRQSSLVPPDGWTFTGDFRPPKVGEYWYSPYLGVCGGVANVPRLILVPLPKRKRWVVEQIEDEPRKLEPGESGVYYPYINFSNAIYTNRSNISTEDSKFLVVSIREEEVG